MNFWEFFQRPIRAAKRQFLILFFFSKIIRASKQGFYRSDPKIGPSKPPNAECLTTSSLFIRDRTKNNQTLIFKNIFSSPTRHLKCGVLTIFYERLAYDFLGIFLGLFQWALWGPFYIFFSRTMRTSKREYCQQKPPNVVFFFQGHESHLRPHFRDIKT